MANSTDLYKFYHGDCLEVMKDIQDGSVDMICADPPYGTTSCAWDSIIPLEPMWEHLRRVIKPNGAIVLTASQPFTTILISSNMELFKYCWVWEKSRPSGFAQAKNKPLTNHEDIVVFSDGVTVHKSQSKKRMKYYPQNIIKLGKEVKNNSKLFNKDSVFSQRKNAKDTYIQEFTNYPKTTLKFKNEVGIHLTQKPVALMEYLIKTYTNKGETVLDFCMGSGTTGVACRNLKRNFIGIEKDPEYFEIAKNRINNPNWKPPKRDKEGNQIEEPEGLLPREEVEQLMKIKV